MNGSDGQGRGVQSVCLHRGQRCLGSDEWLSIPNRIVKLAVDKPSSCDMHITPSCGCASAVFVYSLTSGRICKAKTSPQALQLRHGFGSLSVHPADIGSIHHYRLPVAEDLLREEIYRLQKGGLEADVSRGEMA